MSFCSHSIVTLRRRRARQDARAAAPWCTRRGSGASRVAGRAGEGRLVRSGDGYQLTGR
jgi:hypothetical protein